MSVIHNSNFAHPKAKLDTAFAAELAQELPALMSMALRYTKNAHKAEDLVHDTVEKALRAKDQFQQGSSLRRWSATILSHTFFHRYRRERLERSVFGGERTHELLDAALGYQAAPRQTADDLIYSKQMRQDVALALMQLAPNFRVVIALCDLQGLSYRQVATILMCPIGTVMSRLHRGRKVMAKALAEIEGARAPRLAQQETL